MILIVIIKSDSNSDSDNNNVDDVDDSDTGNENDNAAADINRKAKKIYRLSCIPGCPETLEDQLATFGQVLTSSALPCRTQALGTGIRQSVVGKPTFVTVATRDWQVRLVNLYSKISIFDTLYDKYLKSMKHNIHSTTASSQKKLPNYEYKHK